MCRNYAPFLTSFQLLKVSEIMNSFRRGPCGFGTASLLLACCITFLVAQPLADSHLISNQRSESESKEPLNISPREDDEVNEEVEEGDDIIDEVVEKLGVAGVVGLVIAIIAVLIAVPILICFCCECFCFKPKMQHKNSVAEVTTKEGINVPPGILAVGHNQEGKAGRPRKVSFPTQLESRRESQQSIYPSAPLDVVKLYYNLHGMEVPSKLPSFYYYPDAWDSPWTSKGPSVVPSRAPSAVPSRAPSLTPASPEPPNWESRKKYIN